MTISEEIKAYKKRLIVHALRHNEGNIRATARSLGTPSTNLDRWLRELGLVDYAYRLRVSVVVIDPDQPIVLSR